MIKKWRTVLFTGLLALVFIFSYTACNSDKLSGNQPESGGQTQPEDPIKDNGGAAATGSAIMAPDFTLTDFNGKEVSLSDFRGKVVILNFWASWCPPCKAEMPDFDKVNRKLIEGGGDAVILTVNLTDGRRETEEKARNFIRDNDYSLYVLMDKQGEAANAYNVSVIPTTYIINRDGSQYTYMGKGNIKYKYFEGSIDEETLLDILNQLEVKL